jgi:hypothetical protein
MGWRSRCLVADLWFEEGSADWEGNTETAYCRRIAVSRVVGGSGITTVVVGTLPHEWPIARGASLKTWPVEMQARYSVQDYGTF